MRKETKGGERESARKLTTWTRRVEYRRQEKSCFFLSFSISSSFSLASTSFHSRSRHTASLCAVVLIVCCVCRDELDRHLYAFAGELEALRQNPLHAQLDLLMTE